MKILYIGTVSEATEYERIVSDSKVKPSSAPHLFETTFLEGMIENGFGCDNLEILSFPMIAAYPGSKLLCWGRKSQTVLNEFTASWIPTINLPFLKMISQSSSSKKMIEKWLIENIDNPDKCVLLYSIYYPIAKNVLSLCKRYSCKCLAFVPDLPEHMYASKTGIKKQLSRLYVNRVTNIQGMFDGYIYFVEPMKDRINPNKPYTVLEGIASINNEASDCEKKRNVILYAGAISKRYGFDNLVQAFSGLEGDYELHIYGYGDYVDELIDIASTDPRIRYFGRVSHDEVIKREREAGLLVNVRNCDDEYTAFSFPSKTFEYMLSGTPFLTTKLPGIPEEYFTYCLSISNNSPDAIREALVDFFRLSNEERDAIGARAKAFIVSQKNSEVGAKKVIDFIDNILINNQGE